MIRDKYLVTLGKRIKEIRFERGLTVREVSKTCNLDSSNFCRLENGQKNFHILTLKRIADALEVDVKYFL